MTARQRPVADIVADLARALTEVERIRRELVEAIRVPPNGSGRPTRPSAPAAPARPAAPRKGPRKDAVQQQQWRDRSPRPMSETSQTSRRTVVPEPGLCPDCGFPPSHCYCSMQRRRSA